MIRNRENLPGVSDKSYEYIHTPTGIAKQFYLYIEYIGHAFCDRRYCLLRNSYAHYLLMYVVEGSGVLFAEGSEYYLEPGQVFLIQTEKPHIYGALEEWETLWVHFNGQHFNEFYRHLVNSNGGHVFELKDQNAFTDCFMNIMREYESPSPAPEIMVSAKLYELLALLVGRSPESSISPIDSSISYINRNFGERITVGDLARQVSISTSRFSALFKQETGYSPYHYVINTRLHAACQLLSSTTDSVEQIALDVGFNDASSFIYSFRKKYRVSPAKFRKRVMYDNNLVRDISNQIQEY